MNRSTPGLLVHHQLITHSNSCMSIESVMPSSHLILCRPLLLLPSIFSSIRVFSKSQFIASGSQSIGASASASVLSEHSGLISFKTDWFDFLPFVSVQFSSVAQSCSTLCDPMNCSTSGLPVHHQLPEFTHTHIHRVRDAIQPSHPLSSPSPPAPNPSQHQRSFQ